ncbi:MAG: aldehyde:ferredoxin oxidoreductase, partial [Deltaproteobacteria bacterium]|nr:aldehyde:ferredoxin oxidoreductase [Deltaproteobacteria bacterium]
MTPLSIKKIKEISYQRPELEHGYAGKTLSIDLTDNKIRINDVTETMKRVFIGGKGFDLWLLWNAVTENTRWNDPENAICISCGPLGGTPTYPGSGKSIVATLSPP